MLCKKTFTTLGTTVLLIFLLFNTSYADIINGDFSSGLDGWTTAGDTFTINEYAVIGDNNNWWSYLYQPIASEGLSYTIDFDFKNNLSGYVPDDDPFAFYDTFFASVYFVNDIAEFDLEAFTYDDSLALFDMDSIGAFNINGTVSDYGTDWLHFSTSFTNEYNYIILTFELVDFNFIDNDSQVFIDNVNINPVPEPATLLLLVAGMGGLGVFSRRKKKH